jgi:hypothetical protein
LADAVDGGGEGYDGSDGGAVQPAVVDRVALFLMYCVFVYICGTSDDNFERLKEDRSNIYIHTKTASPTSKATSLKRRWSSALAPTRF